MELTKKTTILFTPELHRRLSQLAEQKGASLGELVRAACERQYGLVSNEARLEAVKELGILRLPVTDIRTMKRQSVPSPSRLLP